MVFPLTSAPPAWRERLLVWSRRTDLAGRLAIALAIGALLSGLATYVALTPGLGATPDPVVVRILLLTDLVLLLLLMAVVARRLVKLWAERRRGSAGSRLHTRIVALFSVVAVAPAIVMAVFSALFFHLGLQTWFSQRVTTAVRESVAVAEAYIQEHRKTVQADVLAMAADLNRDAARLLRNPALFNSVVNSQARLRALSEAIVFNTSGQVLARSSMSLLMEFERLPTRSLERANAGEVAILTSETDDRVRALVRLDSFLDAYLYVGRFVDPRVVDHYERAQDAAAQYERMQAARSGLEITFAALFIVVALLVLLAAIWFGLNIATGLVRPIGSMVAAAEQVRQGDLGARVDLADKDDEMGTLGRAFNRMTAQLAEQRAELVEANRQLDERRRFTETVLAGVSAGVIGVGRDGRITLPNRSAAALLETPSERLIGAALAEAVPELGDLLSEAAQRPDRPVQRQISLVRGGKTRALLVRVSTEAPEGETVGFVVTFDDITDLVAAQRTAAWADVARRIAHEIKNPLTPIQLSAERLKRKYLKEVSSDPDVFSRCTDTIIRQVADIGRMVDEFSAFARMPAPVFRPEGIEELARQAVFLQQQAHAEIAYAIDNRAPGAVLRCDSRQVAQVFTNLLQNAADAIEARRVAQGAEAPSGQIAVRIGFAEDGGLEIDIVDNGRGLPQDGRERLTEPYVTTRTKGTGLGLAIVKKIMEEHGGELALLDAPEGGAWIRLRFPPQRVILPADAAGLAKAG